MEVKLIIWLKFRSVLVRNPENVSIQVHGLQSGSRRDPELFTRGGHKIPTWGNAYIIF